MDSKSLEKAVLDSGSIAELNEKGILPDPCGDDRYYLIWFDEADYKTALKDIISLDARNVKIWYDRLSENGEWWYKSILERAGSYDCRGVVIYLSAKAMQNPFLYRLSDAVDKSGKRYFTVNCEYDEKGDCMSGEQTISAGKVPSLSAEADALYRRMYATAITYVPSTAVIKEKERALTFLKEDDFFEYEYDEEKLEATTKAIKNCMVSFVDVPPYTEKDGKRYNVTALGAYTFANCRFLEGVNVPYTLREIGKPVGGRKPLSEAERTPFEKGLSELLVGGTESKEPEGYTFYRCNSLKKLEFPTVAKVYDYAFVGAAELTSLSLPGIEECAKNSFFDNVNRSSLSELVLSDAVLRIGGSYFDRKTLAAIEIYGCEVKGAATFEFGENVTLEEGIKELQGLFTGNKKLKSIVLPATLKSISEEEFSGCSNLESVKFLCGELVDFESESIFEGCKKLKEIVLPHKSRMVNLKMFDGLKSLKEIFIPASVAVAAYPGVDFMKKMYAESEKTAEKERLETLEAFRKRYGEDSREYRLAYRSYVEDKESGQSDLSLSDDAFIETLVFGSADYFRESLAQRQAKRYKGLDPASYDAESETEEMKKSYAGMPSLKRIYVKDDGKQVKIKNFRQKPSDREGYLLFTR